jgi:glycosyltransferase involved in cell wall biosynthesis
VAISPGWAEVAGSAAGIGLQCTEQATADLADRAPLRVVEVVESTFAGVGRHVADLTEGLLERGHAVHLVYSTVRMEAYFRERITAARDLRSLVLDMDRAPCPGDGRNISRLRGYLRAQGPFDVIHGHSSKGGAIARLAAAGLGISRVYTPHAFRTADPGLQTLEHFVYASVERILGRLASDMVIATSPEEFDEARRLGIAQDRVRLVLNGIRMPPLRARDEIRKDLALENEDLLLLFVGRLVPQKGADRFLDLFARVAAGEPNVRGLIVGSGEMEAQLRARLHDLRLEGRLGLMASQEAVQCMPAADVLVATSRYEAMPYTLIEAQYAGLPVVAFRAGGVSTAVVDGRTGFICEQDDADEFVNALRRLAREPSLRRQMGLAARTRASAFGVDRMIDATEDLYRELRAGRTSVRSGDEPAGARSGRRERRV